MADNTRKDEICQRPRQMMSSVVFAHCPGAVQRSENWPEHLMWASILVYVLSRGPGALSIDRIVAFNLFGRA